jgi:glutamate racemase
MIGIFDSGSGGLTVLKAVRERLPSADVIYFGDIKNVPYGSKSPAEITKLTIHALKLLKSRGATSIISACNSVSASLALSIFDFFPEPIIEMVGPTVAYFSGSRSRILLCATPATIASGTYQSAFEMVGKEISTVAIPDLAVAIEEGKPSPEIERLIASAFTGVNLTNFDVLILGCTHYPLAFAEFRKALPDIEIFDPAIAVAERVEERFWPREAGDGSLYFLISKDAPQFRALVTQFFPDNKEAIEVVE